MLKHTKIFLNFEIREIKCRNEVFTDNIFASLCKRIISVLRHIINTVKLDYILSSKQFT
ncbi:hypothetical protein HanIR_Chr05g0241811 [Helianthus annuus]|nr:hypothetical protein HanIR_Chr05g0241811 [Helianthus annuus]